MYIRKNITAAQEKEYIYLMREKATSLRVVENEEFFGILCATPSVELNHFAYSRDFKITISQNGARKIVVETTEPVWAECLWDMYQDVARFLMIFDGHFLKIHSATFYEGDQETLWSTKLFEEIIRRRLVFYSSADFMFGSYNFSLCPFPEITSELFDKYIDVEFEMDLMHHIALYNMADTGVTVDCKCAQIIELFEPLEELIEKHFANYSKPKIKKIKIGKNSFSESDLRRYLSEIIKAYGQDIFPEEIGSDLDTFTQIMVNSRNRIAHISNKDRVHLDGCESVMYAAKLSMLYRRILLEILGISYESYKDSLIEKSQQWYRYHDAFDHILNVSIPSEKEWFESWKKEELSKQSRNT